MTNSALIGRTLAKFLKLFDLLRGDRLYLKAKSMKEDYACFRIETIENVKLQISVKRNQFIVKYDKPFFSQKTYYTYEVSLTPPEDCPEQLRLIFNKTITFPQLLPRLSSKKNQITAAVTAFLDIVQKEIKA